MIWYALLIPLIISGVGYFFFRKRLFFFELFIPTVLSFIVILISYFLLKSTTLHDVEYNGYVIKEARYYESWETWVEETCSRQVACGTDDKGNTTYCTEYYDCSYCDYNPEYYEMIDSGGHSIGISREKYLSLIKKWKAKPQFNDLNRNIDFDGGCGKDGDMYSIKWNNHIYDSETSTYERPFINILKCNHSAFNYPEIDKATVVKDKLFEYPEINKVYQNSVLGLENINILNKTKFKTKLNYLNGRLGALYKVKVFTLLFKDKDINVAFKQEAYWDGGNQNEIVVCIGVDKQGNISWVKPFSWCDNKMVVISIRDNIMDMKKLEVDGLYNSYKSNIIKYWHYKSFKDFDYLSFEPTKTQLIWVYLITFIISLISFFWTILNDIDDDYQL